MRRTQPSLNQQAGLAPGRAPVSFLAAFLMLTALAAPRSGAAPPEAEPKVTEVPEAVVKKFELDTTFYKKHVDYKGFSILGSDKVSDEALLEARYLIDQLL